MKTLFGIPQVVSEEECDRIIADARKLASEVPLRSEGTEEFNAVMSDFGCRVDNGKVAFPSKVIDKVFERIEQEAISPQPARHFVSDQPTMNYHDDENYFGCCVSGQAGLICDVDGKIRPCNKDDLAKFSRLVDNFEHVEWAHPCMIPQDAPPRTREIHAYATIVMNNRKPRLVSAYSKEAIKYFLKISEVYYGSAEKAKKESPFIFSLWLNSPFSLAKDVVEGVTEIRKFLGRPFKVVTMPVAGASAPVTAAGCVVQGTAEVIMANVITMAWDNILNGYFSAPLVMDVRRGASTLAPSETLIRMASVSVARRMFRNDRHVFQSSGIGSMAKTPGAQSMMEKTIGGMSAVLCGGRTISAMSTLSYSDIISPVQFLLDVELVGYLEKFSQGINVDDNTLACDVIKKVAPTGAQFMTNDHTLDNYAAEQWNPMLMDRHVAMAAKDNPKEMLDNAIEKARELWDTLPNKSPLTEAQNGEIAKILEAADQELG